MPNTPVHSNDVIFSYAGFTKLLDLIRKNPDMVHNVTVATAQEIATNNDKYPLGNANHIPGKGITITQADGTKKSIAVGSDVKPYVESTQTPGTDGTITFKVDGEAITIPVDGIVSSVTDSTSNTKIPNKQAITSYIATKLGGDSAATKGYGFIPGYFDNDSNQTGTRLWTVKKNADSPTNANLKANRVYGAVFNDYAEYRVCGNAVPGRVVVENGDGTLSVADERLQLGANIVSDTFGFSIGQTEIANTPIAVAGRVLAYPAEDIEFYRPGAAVCSGPNGTISLMTREEIREWPDAIVGYVSEIPTYEYWGTDNIKVDGRIWIKIK